jgi:response regulator of citrate/malate metabolism
MSAKRVGLGNRREGEELEKALSRPAQVPADEHDDLQEHTQQHVQAHAQVSKQVPVPPQAQEPVVERLHCLLTPSQKAYVEELAQAWGVSQGEVIRYLIRYYQSREASKRQG